MGLTTEGGIEIYPLGYYEFLCFCLLFFYDILFKSQLAILDSLTLASK
jgi:hypothetical protein